MNEYFLNEARTISNIAQKVGSSPYLSKHNLHPIPTTSIDLSIAKTQEDWGVRDIIDIILKSKALK